MSGLQALYQDLAGSLAAHPEAAKHTKTMVQHNEVTESLTTPDKYPLRDVHAQALQKKGQTMFNPPRDSAQSSFLDDKELKRYGYVYEVFFPSTEPFFITMQDVLKAIGLQWKFFDETGFNSSVEHEHCKRYDFESMVYPPTGARFCQVINHVQGTIVAYDNISPMEALKESGNYDAQVPMIKYWSDIAFLQWDLMKKQNADSDLRYILRYNVVNNLTNSMVDTINLENGTETKAWPGTSYDATSKEGQALLGTPNGSSVAYLLIQHKNQLGHKTVEKITVFQHRRLLMMLFYIKNVEA
ncbi:uncharacterized protein K460DRAFT_358868 [Cucurbitaria berberidis CBS 394.84]|uniref:Uncharacterized protein n=1 Tax=Cucurbitaria berberidis CBS 394.84 TaxID=1168544 RepID=A0A9P4GBI9_9PLEO|nr:uncharacterized protein K460DRAFT_358868 [Cucurbitaria berberidis CBS 394.84]KAF1842229.1 hypothetical protein K460DRAFT_358868 [Cucurbitaria berberidis CBS 394.84]